MELRDALRYWMRESDGITVGIPIELAHALTAELTALRATAHTAIDELEIRNSDNAFGTVRKLRAAVGARDEPGTGAAFIRNNGFGG